MQHTTKHRNMAWMHGWMAHKTNLLHNDMDGCMDACMDALHARLLKHCKTQRNNGWTHACKTHKINQLWVHGWMHGCRFAHTSNQQFLNHTSINAASCGCVLPHTASTRALCNMFCNTTCMWVDTIAVGDTNGNAANLEGQACHLLVCLRQFL